MEKELLTDIFILIVGIITDLTVAGTLGIAAVYLIRSTKNRSPILKGVLVGLLSFVILYGGILELEISSVRVNEPLKIFLALFQHILFGLIVGVVINRIRI